MAVNPDYPAEDSKMKHRLIVAFLGIIFAACTLRAADLGLSQSVIDYGTVKEGPPIDKTVILTNNGTRSLAIPKAVAS